MVGACPALGRTQEAKGRGRKAQAEQGWSGRFSVGPKIPSPQGRRFVLVLELCFTLAVLSTEEQETQNTIERENIPRKISKKWKRKKSNGGEDDFYQVPNFILDDQDQISQWPGGSFEGLISRQFAT